MKFAFIADNLATLAIKLEAAQELCRDDPGLYEVHLGVFLPGATAATVPARIGRDSVEFCDESGLSGPVPPELRRWEIEIRRLEGIGKLTAAQIDQGLLNQRYDDE